MSIDARFQMTRGDFNLDVDLSLPDRGISVLFGPSGSGKTSLLRCIAGLETPSSGRLSINETSWYDSQSGLHLPVHQRSLGYVFQEASLFEHLSVQQNLQFGLKRAGAVSDPTRLHHLQELLGIGHLLHRKPNTLSGGERQRIAIARAMAICPDVLLMDEPLAALDASRKFDILNLLCKLKEELPTPIIYVTHSPREVTQLADYLVFLKNGKVKVDGTLEYALTHPESSLSRGNRASTIIQGAVSRHDLNEEVTEITFDGGTLILPIQNLPIGSAQRCRIYARDIILSLAPPVKSTVQNVLPATILDISRTRPGQIQVRLQVGNTVLLSHVTQRAVSELGLHQGQHIVAQFKTSAVL